jgi:hypothetical protein
MSEAPFEIFAAAKSEVEHANESRAFVNEAVKILFNYGLSSADMDALFPDGPFEPPVWDHANGFSEPVSTIIESLARRAVTTRQAEEEMLFRSRPN